MANVAVPFLPIGKLHSGDVPLTDFHVHSTLTDGQSSVEEYIVKARELGLQAIAFTEHAADWSRWLDEYLESRDRLQAIAGDVKVYLGVEVKLAHTDGTISLCPEKASRVDFVVGVLHRYPDGKGGYHDFRKLDPDEAMEIDFNLSKALLSNPTVDVFGHPGGVYAAYYGAYDRKMLAELVSTAAANGKVVELNSKPTYSSGFDTIFNRCLEIDCKVSMGSDAHHISDLGHVVKHIQEVNQWV